MSVAEVLETLSAEDLFHLAHLARERERREAEHRLEEVARLAYLRGNWRTLIEDRPALGFYLRAAS